MQKQTRIEGLDIVRGLAALMRQLFGKDSVSVTITMSGRSMRLVLHVKDAARVAKHVKTLIEMAVFDFFARHSTQCAVCPNTSCSQILQRPHIGADNYAPCKRCMKSYCLCCSAANGEAMVPHRGSTCKDFQAFGGEETERHVRFIRDQILTLSCPQCKSAFLDFDGCTSVLCGDAFCNPYFCANCLDFSAMDSASSHDHVRECDKNPNRGRYFASADQLKVVRKSRRLTQVREYSSADLELPPQRRPVLQAIAQDLEDLGIRLSKAAPASPAPVAAPAPVARGIDPIPAAAPPAAHPAAPPVAGRVVAPVSPAPVATGARMVSLVARGCLAVSPVLRSWSGTPGGGRMLEMCEAIQALLTDF